MYAVGIDIGTTYTAAAVWRDGHAEIVPLGSRSAAVPSAVFLRPDGAILTGEAADRRGLGEPDRVVRQLKRRLGDTAPILLGGTPYSAAALTARILRSVLDVVSAREGEPPAAVCVAHPAGWGPYKADLMHQVVRLADLDHPVRFITEPQAAASFHAHQKRLGPGAVVAVYDLGGGIFEAAVLRKTADGFDLTGEPERNERLGGVELDDAILEHVVTWVGGALEPLEKTDPAAIARLRAECVQAKEALSADTEATIPVLLPTLSTEVRLTRSELEELVRPLLRDSIEALRRTIHSAGYAPKSLGSVLLVGGSARMPIVAQLVSSGLGRPVTVNDNATHAVALGAAWQASGAMAETRPAPASPAEPPSEPTGEIPVVVEPVAQMPPPVVAGHHLPRRPLVPAAGFAGRVTVGPAGAGPIAAPPVPPLPPPARPAAKSSRGRITALAVSAAAVLLLATGGTAWALTRPRGPEQAASVPSSAPARRQAAAVIAADEKCTDEMKKSTRWVCLTKATLHDNTFTVWYQADWNGTRPDLQHGFHLHIYGGDGASPDEATMGSQAVRHSKYYFEDQEPSVRRTSDPDFQAIGDAKKVCARIADSGHGLAKAHDGTYHTGNCIPIQRY
ncbi:Hsp70 family protein [Actinoplanes subtropicus]|uniref:Hsp70 family protein n=1 Tax=Actinoplanes subtropicus TaxID=543632 RepID=UPI0004C3DD24|nr:Hsp70 family protein [Actinoplanes subtropicus]